MLGALKTIEKGHMLISLPIFGIQNELLAARLKTHNFFKLKYSSVTFWDSDISYKERMKTLLTLFLFSSLGCLGQRELHYDTVAVYAEKSLHAGLRSLVIPVDFNEAQLKALIPNELKKLTIQQIDLVYTLYHEAEDFNQKALNEARIAQLIRAWPEVNNDLIQWRSVGQSQVGDAVSARALFHGFVVYYRPRPTEATIAAELDQIDEFLAGSIRSGTKSEAMVAIEPLVAGKVELAVEEPTMALSADSCLESKKGSFHGTEQQFEAFRDS